MSYVNAHQRVTSAEESFNNQGDRMTHSVDTSQLLFPASPVTTQLMNNMAMVVEMKVIHRLSNVDFHSSRPT